MELYYKMPTLTIVFFSDTGNAKDWECEKVAEWLRENNLEDIVDSFAGNI